MSNANCIDVSCFQGTIDWDKVKAAGVKYAILRTIRKGLIIDSSFETFYKEARAAGLQVGVYLYTYATTISYVEKEADALVKLLAGRELDLPVWLDMETTSLRTASASTVQAIANAFRAKVQAAGYQCGIYCDADFYKGRNHFAGFDSGCEFWIASYGANDGVQHTVPTISHHLYAHQYSSKGKISGISCNVDVSICYGPAVTSNSAPQAAKTEREEHNMDTLKNGARGQQIMALQKLLNAEINAGLVVDGIFGAKTEAAVRAYQKAKGLAVDGIVGAKTWESLLKTN